MASEGNDPEGATAQCVLPAHFGREQRPSRSRRAGPRLSSRTSLPDVCGVCGESYLNEDVSAAVYEKVEEAMDNGAHFGVRGWNSPTKTSTYACQ